MTMNYAWCLSISGELIGVVINHLTVGEEDTVDKQTVWKFDTGRLCEETEWFGSGRTDKVLKLGCSCGECGW